MLVLLEKFLMMNFGKKYEEGLKKENVNFIYSKKKKLFQLVLV